MEQIAQHEEKCRLDLASAAIDVAGTGGRHFLLEDVLPKDRRVYLYAVPDAVAGGDGPGISGMVRALEGSGAPHALDWDRKSEHHGLRYLPDYVKVPAELRRFTSEKSAKAWSDWRSKEKEIDNVVASLAATLARDPSADLDATRADRVSERVEDMKDRRRAGPRRMNDDERS